MNYFRKIRLQENAYVFCLWYKQQRDKKGRKVRMCSVADIPQREIWSRVEFQRERRWKCKRLKWEWKNRRDRDTFFFFITTFDLFKINRINTLKVKNIYGLIFYTSYNTKIQMDIKSIFCRNVSGTSPSLTKPVPDESWRSGFTSHILGTFPRRTRDVPVPPTNPIRETAPTWSTRAT